MEEHSLEYKQMPILEHCYYYIASDKHNMVCDNITAIKGTEGT